MLGLTTEAGPRPGADYVGLVVAQIVICSSSAKKKNYRSLRGKRLNSERGFYVKESAASA